MGAREREIASARGNKNDDQRLVRITHDVLAQKRMTNEGLFFILHRIASVKSLRRKNIINSDRSEANATPACFEDGIASANGY